MKHPNQLRVVHVPSLVGGNPQGLSTQLNKFGIHSEVWSLTESRFGYKCDLILCLPEDTFFIREFKRVKAIWNAARQFDVIHFNFGTTLSEPIPYFRRRDRNFFDKIKTLIKAFYRQILFKFEIALYRINGCFLFIQYQGDDARQGDFSLSRFKYSIALNVNEEYYCSSSDAFKRRMIHKMSRICSQIYALNPDLMYLLPSSARFVPYCHIMLDEWLPEYMDPRSTMPIRFGHAPSHRGVKGTDLILAAMDKLRIEGYSFEMELIENLPRELARLRYAELDIFIDQLHAGWYGGLAVEVMALGKPVIVYIREEDLVFISKEMRSELPFIAANPDNIEEVIRKVLNMPREELIGIARRSRAYVERWHDPARIAYEILQDYRLAKNFEKSL